MRIALSRYTQFQTDGTGELLLFDVTGVTQERRWPFSEACTRAAETWTKSLGLAWAVDLNRTRVTTATEPAISPLPLGEGVQLSEPGWTALRRAEEMARTSRYDVVERTHLLAGILASAAELTTELFEEQAAVLGETLARKLTKKSPGVDRKIVPPTEGLRSTLERARQVALELGSGLIGPVQLLHALLESESQTLRRVLREAGIDAVATIARLKEKARCETQRVSYPESRSSESGLPW